MAEQSKAKKKEEGFWEAIQLEFNLMRSSSTIGGSLIHLESLLKKTRILPQSRQVIFQIENQIAEEDRAAFETLQKSVEWIHGKIQMLLPFLNWSSSSWEVQCINSLLKFQIISLSEKGYLGDLIFELKHVSSEAFKNKESHPLFEGWAEINLSACEIRFIFPDYIEQEIRKPPLKEQIYQWKEKADSSSLIIYRYLKILSLYSSFTPLTFPETPSLFIAPQNLQEWDQRQSQANVGYYLSLFKSSDTSAHPLSVKELIKLVEHFLFMLEREISKPLLKGPILKKAMSAAAEAYCVSELVNHVRKLSQEELKEFRKQRYGVEIFNLLSQGANESDQVFANSITPTMLKERAGPEANRILFQEYGIVWHTIPQK